MDNGLVPNKVSIQQLISSDGLVDPFDEFTFQSANRIELFQGFEVEIGGVFKAIIDDCEE